MLCIVSKEISINKRVGFSTLPVPGERCLVGSRGIKSISLGDKRERLRIRGGEIGEEGFEGFAIT